MRLVFWQPMVSPHQSATLRALAARGHECILIVDQVADPRRLSMGWTVPNLGLVSLVIGPDEAGIHQLVRESSAETIHVFSGYRASQVVETALASCLAQKARVGVISEAGICVGMKGVLRRGLAMAYALRYRGSFDFFLAMGDLGVAYYRRAGFPRARLFSFGYTVEAVEAVPGASGVSAGDTPFTLLFVGTLDHRKGADRFMEGLARLSCRNWRAIIVGDGPMRSTCQEIACRSGTLDRVEFLGYLPSSSISGQIDRADLMVIPSRFDGWGVLTNEAIQVGTPVLCSDQVGSCVLLKDPMRGSIYPHNNIGALATALERAIVAGKLTKGHRAQIKAFSESISGEAMATYLEHILHHVYAGATRPVAPWDIGQGA